MDHRARGHRGTRRATALGRRAAGRRRAGRVRWRRVHGDPHHRLRRLDRGADGAGLGRPDQRRLLRRLLPDRRPSARRSTARATPSSGTGPAGPRRRRPRRAAAPSTRCPAPHRPSASPSTASWPWCSTAPRGRRRPPSGPAPTGPTGGQYQVSCTSPTFCASVNTAGVATLFDGTTWGHDALVDDGTAVKPVQNISCASPTFCVVVSATGNIATFNGDHVDPAGVARPVAAPLGVVPHDEVLHGRRPDRATPSCGTGRRGRPPRPCRTRTRSPSRCRAPRPSRCLVARSDGSVSVWQSGTWSAPQPVLSDGTVAAADVSCASASFCAVVDTAGSAATTRA